MAAERDSAANGHPFRATVTHAGRLDLTVAALRLIAKRLRGEQGDTYVLVEALDVGNQLVVRTLDDDPRHLIDPGAHRAGREHGERVAMPRRGATRPGRASPMYSMRCARPCARTVG